MIIRFEYVNHRGEKKIRRVDIDSVEFHRNPGFGYQPGWFISGWDYDRAARRSFALSRIVIEEEESSHNVVFKLLKIGEMK